MATGDTISTTETQDDQFGNPGAYLFNFVNPQPVNVHLELPAGVTLLSKRYDRKFDASTRISEVIPLVPDLTVTNLSAGVSLSGSEICDNGIDDDRDGRIDDRDSDCTSCVVAESVICGDKIRYYMPPVWQMNDPGETTYAGPSYLIISTSTPSSLVDVYDSDRNLNSSATVTNAGASIFPLGYDLGQTSGAAVIENDKGLIIDSDQPIQVIYTIQGRYNKTLVTIKGQQALGNRFRAGSQVFQYDDCANAAAMSNEVNETTREAHFVSAMAVEDQTSVTFEWDESKLTLEGSITSPHTVMLDAGQSFLIRDAYTNQTVSGVGIVSDKAITVVSS